MFTADPPFLVFLVWGCTGLDFDLADDPSDNNAEEAMEEEDFCCGGFVYTIVFGSRGSSNLKPYFV